MTCHNSNQIRDNLLGHQDNHLLLMVYSDGARICKYLQDCMSVSVCGGCYNHSKLGHVGRICGETGK